MLGSRLVHETLPRLEDTADLSGWDFLQDLDVEVDLGIDNCSLPQATGPALSSHERVKEKNRQAQKRARQRQKVCTFLRMQPLAAQHAWRSSEALESVGTVTDHRT